MPPVQVALAGVSPMSPGRIALTIIGMLAIIVAAYYITYLLGSKTFKLRSGRSIILRDRFAVSKDKSFFIIEAYGKVYIVGVTSHSMTVIDTLDAGAVPDARDAHRQSRNEPEEDEGAERPASMRARMTAGMARFISEHILKRGEPGRYNRGGGFDDIYKKTMSAREEEPRGDAEDEE